MINMTLAILAGGKSSRMGKDKAFLEYRDKSFIENIINKGNKFQEILIVSNNKKDYEKFNIKVVQDIYKEKGPIGGIHAALVNSKFNKVLCVACDMPLLSEETLVNLSKEKDESEVVIPKINGRLQPLCAIYTKSLIERIEENIQKNRKKLIDNIKDFDFKILDKNNLNKKDFININTPKDYMELEELYVQGWNNNK